MQHKPSLSSDVAPAASLGVPSVTWPGLPAACWPQSSVGFVCSPSHAAASGSAQGRDGDIHSQALWSNRCGSTGGGVV